MTGRAHEWRYLPGGRVAHALADPRDAVAWCGVASWWVGGPDGWHGTGSQAEYETAAARPRCRRCLKRLGLDAAGEAR